MVLGGGLFTLKYSSTLIGSPLFLITTSIPNPLILTVTLTHHYTITHNQKKNPFRFHCNLDRKATKPQLSLILSLSLTLTPALSNPIPNPLTLTPLKKTDSTPRGYVIYLYTELTLRTLTLTPNSKTRAGFLCLTSKVGYRASTTTKVKSNWDQSRFVCRCVWFVPENEQFLFSSQRTLKIRR